MYSTLCKLSEDTLLQFRAFSWRIQVSFFLAAKPNRKSIWNLCKDLNKFWFCEFVDIFNENTYAWRI